MSKVTKLEGLKLHEVSLVSKGANGEMFEIIKSDNSGNPVEILKSLMKNPETMDGTDHQILKDMNGDMEAYSQYVDEFVPEFIKDLEGDGYNAQEWVEGMYQDRVKKSQEVAKTDGMVTEDDCDKDCKSCDKKKECNSEENEVQKSFLGKVSEVVKNIFGDKENSEKEDSKIEKNDSENKNEVEESEEMNAEQIAKALGEALAPVTQAIEKMNERINTIETDVKGEEVKKEDEKEAEKEEDKTGEVIADAIAKALEPVSKSLEAVSERLNNIEKQERPSARIVEKSDAEDVKKSAPLWGSIQVKR